MGGGDALPDNVDHENVDIWTLCRPVLLKELQSCGSIIRPTDVFEFVTRLLGPLFGYGSGPTTAFTYVGIAGKPDCCAGAKDARMRNKPKKRDFICSSPSVNNDRPFHAQGVMDGADVIENTWRSESDPKMGYTRRRLRQPGPILRSRRQKPRIHAVGR